MAAQHKLGLRARLAYQDRLMPVHLLPTLAATVALLLVDVILIFHDEGFWPGLAAALIGIGLPYAWQAAVPPRRGSPVFLRRAVRRLSRLARSGDAECARLAATTALQLDQAHPGLASARTEAR
ncbi:hypothetical protein [Methylobacterium nigriterrae]|uniref:hypothetical protein n=1 Tax=Methylobacterium nigriterrae TaxID=3127512 RepID=UPI00301332FC